MKWNFVSLLTAAVALSFVSPATARDVADMSGKTVTVPDGEVKALGYNPPISYFISVVEPGALVALNRTPHPDEKPHLPASMLALPVIGGWFDTLSKESLVSLHPDVVLIESKGSVATQAASELKTLGIASAEVRYERLDDIAPLFRFIGKLLNRPERGEALAAFADKALAESDARVAAIPASQRPKVLYLQGPEGQRTSCAESSQMEVTMRVGATAVISCGSGVGRKGQRPISLDEVISLQPDVIFGTDPAFLDTVRTDTRWHEVKAVKDGRVYIAPIDMGGWIDRPPLFTRLLGLTWAYAKLYETPEKGDAEIAAAKAAFFQLFFHEGAQTAQ